jgi:hypothetical protein
MDRLCSMTTTQCSEVVDDNDKWAISSTTATLRSIELLQKFHYCPVKDIIILEAVAVKQVAKQAE